MTVRIPDPRRARRGLPQTSPRRRWSLVPLLLVACGHAPAEAPSAPEPPATAVADAGPDLRGLVGEPITLDGSASSGVSFRWTADGVTLEGATVAHAWGAPGHHVAILEVTGADGRAVTDTVAVTVSWPPLAEPPVVSSALAHDDDLVYVVVADLDRIAVVHRATHALEQHLETCDDPRSVAVDASTIAVACTLDAVDLFDRATLAHRARVELPWGSAPFGVVVDGGEVLVTLQGLGEIARIVDDVLVERIAVGPDLRGLAAVGDTILASRHRSPDGGGEVFRLAPEPVVHTLAHDPGPDSDTDARGVPSYLQRIAVRPDGRVAVVGGLKANIERGLARDGQPLTHETTVRADLRQLVLHPDEGPVGGELESAAFDDRDLVSAAAYHPLGDWLYVAFLGAARVDVLDPWTLARAGGLGAVGEGPDGVLPLDEGLWVSAGLSRELVLYGLDDPAAPGPELARIDLRGALPEPLAPEVLRGKQLFAAAHDARLTESAYVSCASCHLDGDSDLRTWDFSDRGEGLRDTIPLVGRGGAAPLHWSANFDEVQDFEHDIRGPMAGDGLLADADWEATGETLGAPKAGLSDDLDALAAYVESLRTFPRSPWRTDGGGLTPEAEAGAAVFDAAGCPECHPAPDYTDSGWLLDGQPRLHDVGTLGPDSGSRLGEPLTGLDTPTLRGVWGSAPYLHDGSAPTLREVLVDRNPSDLHGRTSDLTGPEIDALVAFLRSLE